MLREYRRRFIRLNMSLIGGVLLLALLLVGLYVYRDYNETLKTSMIRLLEPMRINEGPADVQIRQSFPNGEFIAAFYRKDTGHISLLSRDTAAAPEMVEAAVADACSREREYGVLKELGLIYCCQNADDDFKVALISADALRQPMQKLIMILCAVYLFAMGAFYSISRYTARLAAQPLEEAWIRERQFIADASHELKTPLTVILANTSILKLDPDAPREEQLRWIDSTENTAIGMRSLVEDMLSLSELDARQTAPDLSPVSVSDIVEGAALHLEAVAFERKILLNTDLEPGIILHSNADYLTRIAENLISNALKYEPAGGAVLVSLHCRNGETVFSVHNKLSRIAPDDLPHIFERFYKVEPSGETSSHGLGLSIAQGMTETLGGRITAESSEEKGTIFHVVFKT